MQIYPIKAEHYKAQKFFITYNNGDIEIEKNKFTAIRLLFLGGCRYWESILVSSKISFGRKNYKYLIGYLYKDHKVNPSHIMLP